MAYGPQAPFLDPDNYLYGQYYPGEPRNQSHVNDPALTDLLLRQRRTYDNVQRRQIIYDLQRYLANQQYYVQLGSPSYTAVWDAALKNYGPNLGFDYGGAPIAARAPPRSPGAGGSCAPPAPPPPRPAPPPRGPALPRPPPPPARGGA